MNKKASYGQTLLAAIPENLWDTVFPELEGHTPREAAVEVDEAGCLTCGGFLRRLGKAA